MHCPTEEELKDIQGVERDPKAVQELIEQMEGMMENEEYDYAEETLAGICDWVEKNRCYTTAQLIAVTNIQENPTLPWD